MIHKRMGNEPQTFDVVKFELLPLCRAKKEWHGRDWSSLGSQNRRENVFGNY